MAIIVGGFVNTKCPPAFNHSLELHVSFLAMKTSCTTEWHVSSLNGVAQMLVLPDFSQRKCVKLILPSSSFAIRTKRLSFRVTLSFFSSSQVLLSNVWHFKATTGIIAATWQIFWCCDIWWIGVAIVTNHQHARQWQSFWHSILWLAGLPSCVQKFIPWLRFLHNFNGWGLVAQFHSKPSKDGCIR